MAQIQWISALLMQSCFVFVICFTGLSLGQTPELEILPAQPVQVKYVGKSMILTCRPRVPNPDLIRDLQWRDYNNRTIQSNMFGTQRLPLMTEHNTIENSLKLYIPSITENMAGTYTCTANYATTERLSASVRLEVNIAITWKDAPTEQNPIVGKDYKIRCEVQASPAPTVDWLRNGQPIVTSQRYVVESKGLLIRNVQETDDGIYTCRASVVVTGEVEERHIKVEVHTPPKMIENTQHIYEFVEGEPATLSCKATGKPNPIYSWIKSSTQENLEKTERFSVNKHTGLLTISRVEQNDHSDFKCVAENPAARAEQIIKVNVLVKPKIYELYNVSIPENTEAKLICKATGRPAPRITFRKFSNKEPFISGVQINDDRIIVDTQPDEARGETISTLIINPLSRSDDGLYECIASNKGATVYQNGHLTVEFKPSFANSLNQPPVFTWNNKPGNLSCLAESIPNATIEWRLGNEPIISSPNLKIIGTGPQSNLIVTPIMSKYYTKFKCLATNKYGQAEHYIELKQAYPPGVVTQTKVEVITATTIKFSIIPPPTYGAMPLTAFTVQYKPESEISWINAKNRTWSVDTSYIVENLIPQRTYNFRFAAHNLVGMGPWSGDQLQTMPSRSSPEEPKLLTNTVSNNPVVSPYADHYELRWKIPADNGERIDFYQIKYCPIHKVNDEWTTQSEDCEEEQFAAFETTAYELNKLIPDSYYKIELRAHNAIGYSTPAELIIKTARGLDTMVTRHEEPVLSSAMIIGIVIAAVFLILIIVDLSCFCVNRAGILMCICEKIRGKPVDDDDEAKLGSYKEATPVVPPSTLPLPVKLTSSPIDEKEPLRANGGERQPVIDSSLKRNTSIEFDGHRVFSKTGEIIGKNSAV